MLTLYQAVVVPLVRLYRVKAARDRAAYPDSPSPEFTAVARALLPVWHTVTTALRTNEHVFKSPNGIIVRIPFPPLPIDMLPKGKMFLNEWLSLGALLELSPSDAYIPRDAPRSVDKWWRSTGCSWTGCICFGSKPNHTMRVCKGCCLVVYCSQRCQTR